MSSSQSSIIPIVDRSGSTPTCFEAPGVRVTVMSEHGEPVPFRRIDLSDTPVGLGGMRNPSFYLPEVRGLKLPDGSRPVRARTGVGEGTQLSRARAGEVTPEMSYVATRENANLEGFKASLLATQNEPLMKKLLPWLDLQTPWTGEKVRDLVARRVAVIPANVCHPEVEPMGISRHFHTKVNANLGTSVASKDWHEELQKLEEALHYGADTVMDLSTGKHIAATRNAMLRASPVPLGTVPIYECLERVGGDPLKLSWEAFKAVMLEQAQAGVDYMTIHAATLKAHVELTRNRMTGIVSRGGGLLARWMMHFEQENFLYTHFDEILDMAYQYDVTLSLGDGLRSGSLFDGNDGAQFAELKTLGVLNRRAGERGVQVMIEGPGHIPLPGIELNQIHEEDWCEGAPFYTLGPLVSDIGAGYDHVTAAMGGLVIASHGTAMLCYVTPKEHLGLPKAPDVREGMVVFKLAAHAADVARGVPGAILRDHLMSSARFEFRWEDQFQLSLDPEKARRFYYEDQHGAGAKDAHFCSMCGPKYCPMRLAHQLFDE